MINGKTVIIGATPNTTRYAWMAASMLREYGYDFVPVGIKAGEVLGQPILDLRKQPSIADVDTITLYIGPRHQPEWYDYLIGLKPRRVIFNPGTENAEYESLLEASGIEAVEACTLVMLRTGQY
ncbi:MAG: CoA-binding protein [Cyclobacteriaceae bacterium]|nr:CoA-binding protein [Cyclobacteriaceae bacterium]